MKFLKFRYIFTLAIVLVIGITLMVYFLGGLSATALDDTNLEFSYEGYLDYSEYDEEGIRFVFYDTLAEMKEATKDLPIDSFEEHDGDDLFYVRYFLSSEKIVAQNDQYTMFLDEKTTIVTVAVNNTYTGEMPTERTKDNFLKYQLNLFGIKYDTAINKKTNDEESANLLLRYVGSNAKESSIIYNTYDNSVSYHDKLVDQKRRHYKINFNIKDGIEILYEIGDFTIYDSFFPEFINREDFFNYFKGNLVFVVNSDSIMGNSSMLKKNTLEYASTSFPNGYAYTSSKECAAYLEEQGVATVVPNYYQSTELDESGEKIPTRYDLINILEPQLDEEGNEIINPSTQLPIPTNVLKLKSGFHFNPENINEEGASPCVTNPFANSYTLQDLFTFFYGLIQKDEEKDKTYATDWRYSTEDLSPTFNLTAKTVLQKTKMYEYMYKMNTVRDPNILYEKTSTTIITEENYLNYVDDYPGITVGDKLYTKIPVSYFEDINKVFYGYINSGEFYEDAELKKPIQDTNKYDYFVDTKTSTVYILNEEDKYVKVDKSITVGGFQARDDDGNFLYDEEGKPVQEVFTVELANVQNEKYGKVLESIPPIFQVAMRFELTDKGLQTTILDNSILEGLGKEYVDEDGKRSAYSHDLKISRLQILPYFTTNNDSESKGQIILPDGSGSIISFNSTKATLNYDKVIKRIYGADKAFTFDKSQESTDHEKLMFGMFGYLDQTNKKGVLAIIDQGASQSSIEADFQRENISRNYAFFETLMRENEDVFVGSAGSPFKKWANERSRLDLKYIYNFLEEADFVEDGSIQYNTLAQEYRNYLIEKYDLEEKDNTSDNMLTLNFLGSFEKREVSFGFAHNVDYSLTTFAEAQAIINELYAEGAKGFAVSYTGWTRDAMEPQATNNIKVAKVLGNLKGLQAFKDFLDEKNINFYPELRITSNKGYDYSFGNLKYTAKGVGSTYAQHREFDLATRRANNTIEPITMLSPVYYKDYTKGFLESYHKIGLTSAYLSDIGNVTVGDYAKSRTTYAEKGVKYQQDALGYASENLDSIMVSAPYDYALKYTDFAVNIPFQSTLLKAYDYTIPFYQLVVSGLFDYAGPPVNYDSEHDANWFLLKSIETGSNLQFMVSASDPKILLDTDYTMYYESYYTNSKNDIIRMNNIINSIGILGSRLIAHKILKDDVFQVEYENGVTIVINYTDTDYNGVDSGLLVKPNTFVVIKEAN